MRRCAFLKNCRFLDPLPLEFFGKLASALEYRTFAAGEYIVRQGEEGTCFYIIESGTVRCTQVKASRKEIELMCVLNVAAPPSRPPPLIALLPPLPLLLLLLHVVLCAKVTTSARWL